MLTDKEYKALAVLSARLAESVLMDWDKEEQVRLAKEVATKCHSIFNDKESREFVSLVKMMRDAQEELDVFEYTHEAFDYKEAMKRKELISKVIKLESEVDEYLKKMEE
jgi:hypothetical protein